MNRMKSGDDNNAAISFSGKREKIMVILDNTIRKLIRSWQMWYKVRVDPRIFKIRLCDF